MDGERVQGWISGPVHGNGQPVIYWMDDRGIAWESVASGDYANGIWPYAERATGSLRWRRELAARMIAYWQKYAEPCVGETEDA